MGVGMASGPNSAREAARLAVHSPLIGHEIRGATGILLSVSGGESLSLHDAMEIAQIVREAADDSCNIIFGATVDPDLRDQLWVTVIATGFADGATSQANVTAPASAPLGRDARAEASTGPGRVPVANGVELPPFLAQP
jgi:cell division protein FtsZ